MNPAIIGFSASLFRDGRMKDTLKNVKETKCFVHNLVTEDLVEVMNRTAEELPANESEFEAFGLTPVSSRFVKAPRVKESKVQMECELFKIVSLGDQPGNGQLILGKIVFIHLETSDFLSKNFQVNPESLDLVSRLGGLNYMKRGEVFSLPRN